MPRIAENTKSLVADLAGRIERLVAAARSEGHDEALAEVRSLLGGGTEGGGGPGEHAPVGRKRGRPLGSRNRPKAGRTKSGKKRKNPWASLSPAERLARYAELRVMPSALADSSIYTDFRARRSA